MEILQKVVLILIIVCITVLIQLLSLISRSNEPKRFLYHGLGTSSSHTSEQDGNWLQTNTTENAFGIDGSFERLRNEFFIQQNKTNSNKQAKMVMDWIRNSQKSTNFKNFHPWAPPQYGFRLPPDDTVLPKMYRNKERGLKFRKKILIWNTDNKGVKGRKAMTSCPVPNCEMVTDRAELNSSDAVVWLTFALKKYINDQPAYRIPNQRWVLYTREPPYEILSQLDRQFDNKFDLLSYHRTDADIPYTYGYLSELNDTEKGQVKLGVNHATGRSGLVVWFVSHCHTTSFREMYVEELQKIIKVDVYGGCGRLKCGETGIHNYNTTCVEIKLKYKFYLAFENSICQDYITEKLWWALEEGIVPIVLGGADYSKFIPKNSYINIRNFSSPNALAEYLLFLDSNDKLYNEYFLWKLKYKVSFEFAAPCQLCYLLNTDYRSPNNYSDIRGWLNRCENPVEFYRKISDTIPRKIKNNVVRDYAKQPL